MVPYASIRYGHTGTYVPSNFSDTLLLAGPTYPIYLSPVTPLFDMMCKCLVSGEKNWQTSNVIHAPTYMYVRTCTKQTFSLIYKLASQYIAYK